MSPKFMLIFAFFLVSCCTSVLIQGRAENVSEEKTPQGSNSSVDVFFHNENKSETISLAPFVGALNKSVGEDLIIEKTPQGSNSSVDVFFHNENKSETVSLAPFVGALNKSVGEDLIIEKTPQGSNSSVDVFFHNENKSETVSLAPLVGALNKSVGEDLIIEDNEIVEKASAIGYWSYSEPLPNNLDSKPLQEENKVVIQPNALTMLALKADHTKLKTLITGLQEIVNNLMTQATVSQKVIRALKCQVSQLSRTTMKVQKENKVLRAKLVNISEATSRLQVKQRSIYSHLQNLTTDSLTRDAQTNFSHLAMIEKIDKLQGQTTSLGYNLSQFRVQSDDLFSANKLFQQQEDAFKKHMESEVSKLRNKTLYLSRMTTNGIGFTVQFSYDPVENVSQGAIYKFNQIVTNVGNAYNDLTGEFKAPVTGLFMLHLSLMSTNKTPGVHLLIKKEGLMVGQVWVPGENSVDAQGSATVLVVMQKGQRAWVEHRSGSTVIRGGPWSVFSGFLVQAQGTPEK